MTASRVFSFSGEILVEHALGVALEALRPMIPIERITHVSCSSG